MVMLRSSKTSQPCKFNSDLNHFRQQNVHDETVHLDIVLELLNPYFNIMT